MKGRNEKMTNWVNVRDSRIERPLELDVKSSPTTVYERRNIQQVTTHDDMSETDIVEWTYEQREYTQEEYALMLSPAIQKIQQSISDLQLDIAML